MSTLLVVDDEVDLTRLMQARLEPLGHRVHTHNCCKTAFETAKTLRPDFVVLDVMLGDGAGYQVSRRIRSDPELYLTPVLFMSTLGERREVEYSFAQGGDQYLTKPFKLDDLLGKIAALEKLGQNLRAFDPVTRMAGADRMAREVGHRLLREESFALAHAVVEHLPAYRAKRGPEAVDAVAKAAAATIRETLKRHDAFECFCAHLGGAHFLVMTRVDDAKKVCRALPEAFAERLPEFYNPVELEQGYQVASMKKGIYSGHALMELRVCLTHTGRRAYATAHEMIQELRQTHQHAAKHDDELVFAFKQGKKW